MEANTQVGRAARGGVKKAVLQLYLPVDLIANLKRVAREENRSVSGFLTVALSDLRDPQFAESTEPPQAA